MKGQWIQKPSSAPTVVFVHGVLSNGEACWTSKSGAYWPTLVSGETSLANVGVYVFTYETGIFSGTYRVDDAVDSLREHLSLDLPPEPQSLIFVCHSLGGIVVRKLLVDRASEFAQAAQPIGVFLVASPSLGSDYATWLAPLARFFKHDQAAALRFCQSNAWLSSLDKQFFHLLSSKQFPIAGKELLEDKFILLPALFSKQVVEPFAGAKYFPDPYKVPNSDHFSIAKPDSDEAVQHRLLVRFIIDHLPRAKAEAAVSCVELAAPSRRVEPLARGATSKTDWISRAIEEMSSRLRKSRAHGLSRSELVQVLASCNDGLAPSPEEREATLLGLGLIRQATNGRFELTLAALEIQSKRR